MVRVTSRTMETTVARTGRLTIAGLMMLAGQTGPSLAAPRDEFYWMTEINKAGSMRPRRNSTKAFAGLHEQK